MDVVYNPKDSKKEDSCSCGEHNSCSCSGHENHGEKVSNVNNIGRKQKEKTRFSEMPKEKRKLIMIITAIFFYGAGILANQFGAQKSVYIALLAIAYIVAGKDVFKTVFKNISRGNFLDENFLMTIATIGAVLIGEYTEAVGVMLFYNIGEYFEFRAVNKSRKNIEELMNIKPEIAYVIENGEIVEKDPDDISVGEHIIVKVGDKVPLDGFIVKGKSRFDTSAITGESVLKSIGEGEEITSGIINKNAVVEVEVTKEFSDSTVSKILDLVENSVSKKAKTENFITVFARYYTPIVVALAVAVVLIPTFVLGQDFSTWLYRGLIFLVVSCPCALVLSIPLSYFSGIGVSSKNGILVKGSNYIEALKNVDTVLMDKTGTITRGVFEVSKVNVDGDFSEDELLKYAAIAESRSSHPIANSITAYCKGKVDIDTSKIEEYEEISAHGIRLIYDGIEILAGNDRLMKSKNIKFNEIFAATTKVYIAVNGIFCGSIEISDKIKPGMKNTIKEMKSVGIKNIVMLTGDSKEVAEEVANEIGIDRYYSELLPNDKVDIVEKLMSENSEPSKTAFIGDGINDAPVIARADVGISMGGLGSDAAIEASDVVFMTDEVSKIVPAIEIARKTNKIVWQNIIFAIGVKVLVLILSVLGLTNMWVAIFADVGVTILAVINSLRILKYNKK